MKEFCFAILVSTAATAGILGLLVSCHPVYQLAGSTGGWRRKVIGTFSCLAIIGLYMNTGWFLGEWFLNNVMGHVPDTFFETFAAGGWEIFTFVPENFDKNSNESASTLLLALGWLPLLVFILASWIIRVAAVLLWLIFAGGGAELIKGIFD